ncbi:hypothetical protein ACFLZL_02765 [Thermodesulfobacteriota bacterium]
MLKFRFYENLLKNIDKIKIDSKKAADDIGIPSELRGNIGLSATGSPRPPILKNSIIKAVTDAARKPMALRSLVDEIREIVKSYYGDEYDVAPTNSCESALDVCYESLIKPTKLGIGASPARCITPYELHMGHHQCSYGIPFQPKYKDIFAEEGVTSGELGLLGRRKDNVEIIFVKPVGAEYPCHGIKYFPVRLLSKIDPEKSIKKMRDIADKHLPYLAAIVSLGYDSPGFGHGPRDEEGNPLFQKLMGEMANDYDIIYLNDNAKGIPFIGGDIRKLNADVMTYSMDKVAGATISGLIIGKEEPMIAVRRMMGFHSERQGTISAYGKTLGTYYDPGREGLLSQIATLNEILKNPESFKKPVDDLFDIVTEEFKSLNDQYNDCFEIFKSYNMATVEVNYAKSWETCDPGVPMFPLHDSVTGHNLINVCLSQMGIVTLGCHDANMTINPGHGTTDENGQLLEKETRYAVKALVRAVEILCKYAGVKVK